MRKVLLLFPVFFFMTINAFAGNYKGDYLDWNVFQISENDYSAYNALVLEQNNKPIPGNKVIRIESYVSDSLDDINLWRVMTPGDYDSENGTYTPTLPPLFRVDLYDGENNLKQSIERAGHCKLIFATENQAMWTETDNYRNSNDGGTYLYDGSNIQKVSFAGSYRNLQVNTQGQVLLHWSQEESEGIALWDGSSLKNIDLSLSGGYYNPFMNNKGHVIYEVPGGYDWGGLIFYDGTSTKWSDTCDYNRYADNNFFAKLSDDDMIVYQKNGKLFSYYKGLTTEITNYWDPDSAFLGIFDKTVVWSYNGNKYKGVAPEPASMILFGLGSAAMAVLKKRKNLSI